MSSLNTRFRMSMQRYSGFLQEQGIDVLDITPAFKDEDDPIKLWVALDDAHPNARAHKIIADASYDYIADKIED